MDLKVKDVADLLNVSENTVRTWVSEDKIPYYIFNEQPRFSRIEIESWVLTHKQKHGSSPSFSGNQTETSKTASGNQKFSLYRALHKGQVLCNVEGRTKEEILQKSAKLLSHSLSFDPELLTELLLDREKLQPTGLNNGIAIPHNRDFHLSPSNDIVAIVFPENAIPFGSLDGLPVHTLFFLFASSDKRHLHLLAKIAHLASQKKSLELLTSRPSKEKLLEYIHAWEEGLPSK